MILRDLEWRKENRRIEECLGVGNLGKMMRSGRKWVWMKVRDEKTPLNRVMGRLNKARPDKFGRPFLGSFEK